MSDITINATEVINNLNNLNKRARAGLLVIGNATASDMKEYAQSNRRWTDRTGSAKSLITSKAEWQGDTLDISIKHGVDYGIWLETRIAFQGKYKILEEARDSQVQSFKEAILSMGL